MKQTAVEFLCDELHNVIELYKSEWEELDSIVKKAKEMEKEQMIEFANSFYDECGMQYGGLEKSAEQYYNETFNTKEK
jgi:hypothetical protein